MCVCGRGSTVLLQMCVLLVRERVCKQVRKTKTVCVTEYYYTCKKERFVAGGLLEQQGRRMHVFVCTCVRVCAHVSVCASTSWCSTCGHVLQSQGLQQRDQLLQWIYAQGACVYVGNVYVCVWVCNGPASWWVCYECVKYVWVSVFVYVFFHPLTINAVNQSWSRINCGHESASIP